MVRPEGAAVGRRSRSWIALGAAGLAIALGCGGGTHGPHDGRRPASRGAAALPKGAELTRDPANGTVRFLKGQDLSHDLDADPAFKASRSVGDAEGVARAFVEHFGGLWRLDDVQTELVQHRIDVDRSGACHVRFGQVWHGVPVAGAELVVHLDRERRVVVVSGSYVPTPREVGTTPEIHADAAREVAAREIGGEPCTACPVELVVFAEGGAAPRLAWRVAPATRRGDEVLVDATSGALLRRGRPPTAGHAAP